jgi:hypothetical protein
MALTIIPREWTCPTRPNITGAFESAWADTGESVIRDERHSR